ncbi:hypothetical protein TcCL_ESM08315 [Trypanosoma cruzi]|nr:hypothetical protein TcCL_ESM08315 [Trypanosoma cruzi]
MLGIPKQLQSLLSTTKAFPQWMKRSIPWFVVGSAVRGVCDEVVAEEQWLSLELADVLCPFFSRRYAWHFRWRPAREAPVKKTLAPLQHPRARTSSTIGTPG